MFRYLSLGRQVYKLLVRKRSMEIKCIKCGDKGRIYLGWKSGKKGKPIRDKAIFCMMCKPMGWVRKNKK